MNFNLFLKIALLFVFWFMGTRAIPQCVSPDGIEVSDISSTTAKISWNSVSSANQYKVNIEDANDNRVSFNVETKVTATQFIVTGMNANSDYKVKVRSFCGEDHSDWSDRVFFSTAGGGSSGGGGTGGDACEIPGGLGVTLNGTTATLSWASAGGADQYEVQIEDGDNTPAFNSQFTVSGNSQEVSGLVAGGEYKFKVKSLCGGNSSDHSPLFFFTVDGSTGGGGDTGGGACEIPGGLGVTLNGTTATLSWSSAGGADQYEVQIEDGDNTPAFNSQFTVAGTSQEVSGLVAGGEYKFKVKSLCGGNSSDHSPLFFFTVDGSTGGGGGTGGGACEIPGGLGVTLNGTTATLSWSSAGGADQYEVQIEDGDNTPAFNSQFTVAGTSQEVSGLVAGGEYKFKVKSLCGGNSSDHSPLFFFTVDGSTGGGGTGGDACEIPGGLGVTLNGTTATLSWSSAGGADQYEVQIEDGDNTPAFNSQFTVSGTNQEVSGLVAGGEYKFKVKSLCGGNSSDHSPLFFFTVDGSTGGGGGNNGSGKDRNCGFPAELSIGDLKETSVTLHWSTVGVANRYEVEIEDGDNTPSFKWVVKTNGTSQEIVGLVAGGEYKFKVKSICGNESSDHSSWFFFTTPSGRIAENVIIQSSIFPNPTVSRLQISISDLSLGDLQVEISNITGEILWRRKYNGEHKYRIEVPVSEFGTGLYQVRIAQDGYSKVHRFLVP